MWELVDLLWPAVVFVWGTVVILYEFVYDLGVFGVACAFAITIVIARWGTWLAGDLGSPAKVITPRFGIPYVIPGTPRVAAQASTWTGLLFGGLLKILSVVFFGITVVAGLKLLAFPPSISSPPNDASSAASDRWLSRYEQPET
jgi:hypothetical protein